MKKICRECEMKKEISEFNIHKTSKDGHNSLCKECLNIERRTKYKERKQNV